MLSAVTPKALHRKSVPGAADGRNVMDRYPSGVGVIVVGTATSCIESGARAIGRTVGAPVLRIVTVKVRWLTGSRLTIPKFVRKAAFWRQPRTIAPLEPWTLSDGGPHAPKEVVPAEPGC